MLQAYAYTAIMCNKQMLTQRNVQQSLTGAFGSMHIAMITGHALYAITPKHTI